MADQSRQKAFLARASTVLAASQGLTPEARQQLAAAASQLRLTPDEWAACMAELGQQTEAGPVLSRYEEDFLVLARDALQRSAGRILSLGRETRLLRTAGRKYQIALVRADQLLDEVCRELDVRRLSRSDAATAFDELARELVGKARRFDERVAEQLSEAGHAWGIPPAEARATARRMVLQNRRELSRRRWKLAKSLALAASAVAAITWTGWIWTEQWRNPNAQASQRPVEEIRPAGLPEWWPAEPLRHLLEEAGAGQLTPGRLHRLGDPSPIERKKNYREFAEWATSQPVLTAIQAGKVLKVLVASDPERAITSDWLPGSTVDGKALQSPPATTSAINQQLSMAGFLGAFAAVDRTVAPADRHDVRFVGRWLMDRPFGPPDQVLNAWWRRLTQLPDSVAAEDLPRALAALRDVSTEWLPLDVVEQLHREAVLAALKSNPGSLTILDPELRIATSSLTETNSGPWLLFWQSQFSNEVANRVGPLLLARLDGPGAPKSFAENHGRLEALAASAVTRKYPAVGERMRVGAMSNELARVWLREQPDNPLTIAVVGQAVNDQLLALLETRAALAGRALGIPPAWRFEPRGADPAAAPEPEPQAALATPSDWRTLAEALAEIGAPDPQEERAGFRTAALEEIVRIAPRFDDLSLADAEILAAYCLAEHGLEEWLAAEKNLSTFRFWPRFLLALADQIEASATGLDQAVTLVQLTAQRQFSVSGEARWRSECRQSLREAARKLLETKTRSTGNRDALAWNETRIACQRIWAIRDQLVRQLPLADQAPVPGDFQPERAPANGNPLSDRILTDLGFTTVIKRRFPIEDRSFGAAPVAPIAANAIDHHDPVGGADLGQQLRLAEDQLLAAVSAWILPDYRELLSR